MIVMRVSYSKQHLSPLIVLRVLYSRHLSHLIVLRVLYSRRLFCHHLGGRLIKARLELLTLLLACLIVLFQTLRLKSS